MRKKAPLQIPLVASMALSAVIAAASVLTYRVVAEPLAVITVINEPPLPPPPEPPRAPEPPPQPRSPQCGSIQEASDEHTPRKGYVQLALGTQPFADVIIDGRSVGSSPFYGPRALQLEAGDHVVDFFERQTRRAYRYRVSVQDDPSNKLIIMLGRAEPPRQIGAVKAKFLGSWSAMSDEQSAAKFESAIDALRARDNKAGCLRLSDVAKRGTPMWRVRAEKLQQRRCD